MKKLVIDSESLEPCPNCQEDIFYVDTKTEYIDGKLAQETEIMRCQECGSEHPVMYRLMALSISRDYFTTWPGGTVLIDGEAKLDEEILYDIFAALDVKQLSRIISFKWDDDDESYSILVEDRRGDQAQFTARYEEYE